MTRTMHKQCRLHSLSAEYMFVCVSVCVCVCVWLKECSSEFMYMYMQSIIRSLRKLVGHHTCNHLNASFLIFWSAILEKCTSLSQKNPKKQKNKNKLRIPSNIHTYIVNTCVTAQVHVKYSRNLQNLISSKHLGYQGNLKIVIFNTSIFSVFLNLD